MKVMELDASGRRGQGAPHPQGLHKVYEGSIKAIGQAVMSSTLTFGLALRGFFDDDS